jgi:prepilin-type N-terminal cleavage/methylation domain-containing protein
MDKTRRDDRGFSLLELMVVCLLLGVTLAASYSVLSAVGLMSNRMSARVIATEESQVFVDMIERELLQASSLKAIAATATANADAQSPFYDIRDRQIGFYVDINHDGKPERVAYYMSGTSLMRQQTTSTNTTYPYSWAASSTPEPVIQMVDPDWTGSVFTYYGSGDWPPPEITSPAEVASISVVTVEVRDTASWAGQTVSYSASSTVRVRATANGF